MLRRVQLLARAFQSVMGRFHDVGIGKTHCFVGSLIRVAMYTKQPVSTVQLFQARVVVQVCLFSIVRVQQRLVFLKSLVRSKDDCDRYRMRIFKTSYWLFLTCIASFLVSTPAQAIDPPLPSTEVEVVVFGGTSAGIMAAVEAGRNGHSVALIEPSYLIGGLMTGGLHKTDIGKRETIGGLSKEFFERVLKYYTSTYGARSPQVKALDYQQKPELRSGYYFEPKIALKIFKEMLDEAGVKVYTKQWLQSVSVNHGRIEAIVTRHYQSKAEQVFRGKIFIDGTYEGDLMAHAGVMYRVGRESRDEYNEPLAGITAGPIEYRGKGDHRVQSYNIRSTICVDPNNRLPIPKPTEYFRDAHAHLIKVVNAHGLKRLDELYPDRDRWAEINGKMDPNKADFIGVNFGYSEGDYEQRARITAKVRDYWLSLWYMLQNDPELPEEFKQDARQYGLPKDEYLESDHITPQIYVRVARRMQGRYMLTQHDVRYDRHKSDPICMGSYGTDCHAIQMIQTEHGPEMEGDFNGAADPYEIPYRCITPYGIQNLLVVAAISATHVAYSSVRMEPVFMMLGHAGGTAAHLALTADTSVQNINTTTLKEQLERERMPLQAPYRPWIAIQAKSPGPYQVGQPIAFEVIEKDVRKPLNRYAWSFDGSGRTQSDRASAEFVFEQPGRYSVMLQAWDAEESFAVPATLDLQVGTEPSDMREVQYLEAKTVGRWSRARGAQTEYRDRVGLVDEGKGDGQSYADFSTVLPKSGRYEVCVAYATAGNRSEKVMVEIEHADGKAVQYVNQRTKDSPFAFTPVGSFRFEGGKKVTVRISNEKAGGHVFIDTVRWRPL